MAYHVLITMRTFVWVKGCTIIDDFCIGQRFRSCTQNIRILLVIYMNTWWRHAMGTLSTLRVSFQLNPLVSDKSPSQGVNNADYSICILIYLAVSQKNNRMIVSCFYLTGCHITFKKENIHNDINAITYRFHFMLSHSLIHNSCWSSRGKR